MKFLVKMLPWIRIRKFVIPWIRVRIRKYFKPWIRIRMKWMRIRNPASDPLDLYITVDLCALAATHCLIKGFQYAFCMQIRIHFFKAVLDQQQKYIYTVRPYPPFATLCFERVRIKTEEKYICYKFRMELVLILLKLKLFGVFDLLFRLKFKI